MGDQLYGHECLATKSLKKTQHPSLLLGCCIRINWNEMVEIFKTDVKCPFLAQQIIAELLAAFVDIEEVSFDLSDIDCILRLVFQKPVPLLSKKVKEVLRHKGCSAAMLRGSSVDQNTCLCTPSRGQLCIASFLSLC